MLWRCNIGRPNRGYFQDLSVLLIFFDRWGPTSLKNLAQRHANNSRWPYSLAVCFTAIDGVALFFVFLGVAPLLAVPVVRNESLVTAEVVEQDIVDSTTLQIEPKQALYRWKLRIIKIEAVQKMANFLAGYEGRSIEALSKEAPSGSSLVGKTIKARVSFRGDEKNGRYWLIGSPETNFK
jgi:hypothetical protein